MAINELGLRRLGILNIFLLLPWASCLQILGRSLEDMIRSLRSVPILSTTLPFVGFTKYSFIYVFIIAAVYFFWISKRQIRVMWFNAAMAILLPLGMVMAMRIYFEQQMAIQQVLRSK